MSFQSKREAAADRQQQEASGPFAAHYNSPRYRALEAAFHAAQAAYSGVEMELYAASDAHQQDRFNPAKLAALNAVIRRFDDAQDHVEERGHALVCAEDSFLFP